MGAEDYALHREGCLFLAGLRDAGRVLNYLPASYDPGEDGQFRTVRTRLLKFASVENGLEWLTVEQIARLVEVTRHARDRFGGEPATEPFRTVSAFPQATASAGSAS